MSNISTLREGTLEYQLVKRIREEIGIRIKKAQNAVANAGGGAPAGAIPGYVNGGLTTENINAISHICLAEVLSKKFSWGNDNDSDLYRTDIITTLESDLQRGGFDHLSQHGGWDEVLRGLTKRLNGPTKDGWRKALGYVADREQCYHILKYNNSKTQGHNTGWVNSLQLQMSEIVRPQPHGGPVAPSRSPHPRDNAIFKIGNDSELMKQRNPYHRPTCYICGKDLYSGKAPRGLETKRSTIMECEHILAFMSGLILYDVYNIKDPIPPDVAAALTKEYYWSHRCCNQRKDNIPFIVFDPKQGIYIKSRENITKMLDRIIRSSINYSEHPAIAIGLNQECFELNLHNDETNGGSTMHYNPWKRQRLNAIFNDPNIHHMLTHANAKLSQVFMHS